MSAPRRHIVRNLVLAVLVAVGSIACGQRGPLVLPEKARPIQRIELPQPQPPPQAPAPTPEKQDDEQKNER